MYLAELRMVTAEEREEVMKKMKEKGEKEKEKAIEECKSGEREKIKK
jgi:ribosome recycling factor